MSTYRFNVSEPNISIGTPVVATNTTTVRAAQYVNDNIIGYVISTYTDAEGYTTAVVQLSNLNYAEYDYLRRERAISREISISASMSQRYRFGEMSPREQFIRKGRLPNGEVCVEDQSEPNYKI